MSTGYSGDMLNPEKKYNYDYYMDLVDKVVAMGCHVLGLKDSTSLCIVSDRSPVVRGSLAFVSMSNSDVGCFDAHGFFRPA